MCHNKTCCNHTHHAIIFFLILSLLLLPNAPNLNFLLHKFTNSPSRPSSKGGDGDAGFLSPPCTTTKMVTAFLYGAVFTFVLMFVSNYCNHNNNDHYQQDPSASAGGSQSIPIPFHRTTPIGLATGRPTDDQGGAEGGGVGVGYALLRTFPIFAYSVRRPPRKLGKGTSVCVICQYKFKDEELVRWLPDCDHLFHLSCIDEWLTSHKTCPCCRADLDVITNNHGSTTTASNGINTTPNYIYDYFNEYSYNVFSR